MSLTIQLDEHESTRVSDERIETRPPEHVDFVAKGVLTVTGDLLGEFEGTALKPTQVTLEVDGSDTVTVDLTEEPSLRLEEVDVGVETPDADSISPDLDALNPASAESPEAADMRPGAIAFTIEGTILNVPEETVERLSEGEPRLKAVTFALDDVAKSDGGSNNDIVVEVTLLGYGIVIYRSGIIEIGTADGVTDRVFS